MEKEMDEELLSLCKTVCYYKLHPKALKDKEDAAAYKKVCDKMHEIIKKSISDVDETELEVVADQILGVVAKDCPSGVEHFGSVAKHILDEFKIFD